MPWPAYKGFFFFSEMYLVVNFFNSSVYMYISLMLTLLRAYHHIDSIVIDIIFIADIDMNHSLCYFCNTVQEDIEN